MKKISFGSFPINEIKIEDRKCLDRYLIKTFSDNISISDAIRNLSITKSLMYITPDTLMKNWLTVSNAGQTLESKSDRTSNSTYEQALKRAFFVLKEFYKKIQHAPFYKEYIYYPIYVEKIEKIDIGGSSENETESTETRMNYSFVILSNDLTKSLKIDEIRYDENATLNFLFLFIEFFSGKEFNKSIHDFDKKDYEFLVKLYQFIEHSKKDPIHLTLDLYKLLGLVKQAVGSDSSTSRSQFKFGVDKTMQDIDTDSLKKYKGMIKHKLVDILAKSNNSSSSYDEYRKAFVDIMEAIFKSEGLNGLFSGVDSSADLGERHQYVYNTNKYQEILNLAKELVSYNELTCQKVVTTDPMDFDFKVEHGEYTIETQSQVVAQRYQEFFKTYVGSISDYLEGIIKVIIDGLNIPNKVARSTKRKADQNDKAISKLEDESSKLVSDNDTLEASLGYVNNMINNPTSFSGPGSAQDYATQSANINTQINHNVTRINQISSEIEQRGLMQAIAQKTTQSVEKIISDTSGELYSKIKDKLLSAIATDLTFIYDDGKRFFSNESVTKGFLTLTDKPGLNPLMPDDFQKIAEQHSSKSLFPQGIDGELNPEYATAQIIHSLQDGFDVMASDTVEALNDLILPVVNAHFIEISSKVAEDEATYAGGKDKNSFFGGIKNDHNVASDVLKDILDVAEKGKGIIPADVGLTLKSTVYRNRFINHILMNFKKMFRVKKVDKILAFDQNVSQLHPLIRKLIAKGKKCQYFKSFIIEYDTCIQLYNLKYLVDTQKFLYKLTNKPPRKLGNPMNRIQEVLFDYLGLKDNPVWIISKTNIFLSMPDDLSLTNTGILSSIPKQDLMDVCKIKASDYWNEKTMGQVSQFGNKKIKRFNDDIDKIRDRIQSLNSDKEGAKDKKKENIEKNIQKEYKNIEKIEDKISKIEQEEKQYKPNAFIFGDDDDANKAENTPLLTDAEKTDLNRKRDQIQDSLLKLNPYDDDEYNEMQSNIKDQSQRTHPFDFEEEKIDKPEPKVIDDEELEKYEKFLKQRENWHNRDER